MGGWVIYLLAGLKEGFEVGLEGFEWEVLGAEVSRWVGGWVGGLSTFWLDSKRGLRWALRGLNGKCWGPR